MTTVTAAEVAAAGLRGAVADLLAAGWRLALVACHDDGPELRVVYALTRPGEAHELTLRVPASAPDVPSLAVISFAAGRFEREMQDLFGIRAVDHPQPRRLVLHAHWPDCWYPMRLDAGPMPALGDSGSFPFIEVEGPGVYEIPVGPIHAGLIEPGHFRFSVVGETILRLKARLWFVHRGMEKLFEGRTPDEGIELAERISGDTAVGHTLAYVTAVEAACRIEVAEPDRLVRAMLLELERIHNHVADLGALANDVGFGIVNAHAQRLRETMLRLNKSVTGHLLLRGGISVGGARIVALPDVGTVAAVAAEVVELSRLTRANSVVADRMRGTAVLPLDRAVALGTLGYVARASGLDVDARRDHPLADLGPAFRVVTQPGGDVLARYLVRAEEIEVSAAVLADLVARLAGGLGSAVALPGAGPEAEAASGAGLGIVEAWRGTLLHRVELAGGRLSRVKIVDPSFVNWPALPVALADTIVPDFPLANKSFNQSYAGNDL